MDHFGIGAAIKCMFLIYSKAARHTGRTTSMIKSLRDGDRIVFANRKEAQRVERLCREVDKKIQCITVNPDDVSSILSYGKGEGRTLFDHGWVEQYYFETILRCEKDIDTIQDRMSGRDKDSAMMHAGTIEKEGNTLNKVWFLLVFIISACDGGGVAFTPMDAPREYGADVRYQAFKWQENEPDPGSSGDAVVDLGEVRDVAQEVFDTIEYVNDREAWGKEDYYQTAAETRDLCTGDCEERAHLILVMLLERNYPPDRVGVVSLGRYNDSGHRMGGHTAFVIYPDPNDDAFFYVVDTRRDFSAYRLEYGYNLSDRWQFVE